jgi:hypothetical protein
MLNLKVMMEGERSEVIRRNASEWKKLARDVVSEGGSSNKNIDKFVDHLMNTNKKGNDLSGY